MEEEEENGEGMICTCMLLLWLLGDMYKIVHVCIDACLLFIFLLVYTDQYNDAWDVVNSAENLSLECIDLVEKLNTLATPLLDIVARQVTLVFWYTHLELIKVVSS